ncbi:sugar ABC transporter permease [Paenibacillus physcomitrellae]|uniref:Sugar ABC transporter permease n=2 Tax=Paenibacillus physcomitrellae TaxID=1619311 RepID=A0ABQ1GQT9_9BACL|nr:sugar ABC transporter permease [Paenibacillus physcomitrellae]
MAMLEAELNKKAGSEQLNHKKTKNPKIKNNRSSDTVMEVLLYIFAVLFLIILIYPLYFIIIASFSDPSSVANGQVWFYPKGFTLDGYTELLKHKNIWVGYRNTILYTIVGTAIGLAVNIAAAYALSRKDLVGRKFLSLFFIFTMFFSGGLIPTFLTVRDFHMYDTFLVMVLPFSVIVYDIIVARTFFQTSIPGDLWEAAQIDGCGNLRYFFQVVLPLSKAIIAVLGLWIAVGYWNSYFNALIYLKNPNLYPLQLILRNILITNQMQSGMGTGEAAQIALRLASMMKYSVIIVATVPILCVYPFIQKYFNQGVMIGAVKE